MAQFASDTFTGTDGTALQAYSADWTRHTSYSVNSVIIGNRAICLASGGSAYWHSGSPASADYSVSCDIYVAEYSPSFSYAGVIGRSSTAANTFYHARHGVGAGWQLYRAVAGAFTLLGSAAGPLTAGSTYALKLDMSGSTIKMFVDGVALATANDTQITAAGKPGIRFSNNSAILGTDGLHLDNFSADEAGAGAHDLTIANASQGNVVANGTVTQTHALTISSAAQGNSVSTGSLVQVHALAIANTTQANLVDDVAIGVGAASDLDIANATQTNTAGAGGVTQEHILSWESSTQQNAASTPAISQTHALTVPNLTQPNSASDGAITQSHALVGANAVQANPASPGSVAVGGSGDLIVSASIQANTSSTGAIEQTHILVISATVQDNAGESVTVTQVHPLTAEDLAQGNVLSDGEVISFGDLVAGNPVQQNSLSNSYVTTTQTLAIASAEQDNRASSGAIIPGEIFEESVSASSSAATLGAIKKPGIPGDTAKWLRTMLEIIIGRRNNKITVPKRQTLTFSSPPTKAECEALYSYVNAVRESHEQIVNRLDS